MFAKTVICRGTQDEGEKPFWISFADLMTACMTVFLVVMAVTPLIPSTSPVGRWDGPAQRTAGMTLASGGAIRTARPSFPLGSSLGFPPLGDGRSPIVWSGRCK